MDKTLEIFKEIMAVPRPSCHEEKIADYLCEFAKEHNLDFYRDEYHNVIVKKNNHSDKTIIMQCHSDMVCESVSGDYDFLNCGIDWYIDGDFLKAHGTTLGGDNGVGVAMILSLMCEEEDGLPNIEAAFTVQEETSMFGAMKLDYSLLSGKTLLNIDGNREGNIEISCASFIDFTFTKALEKLETNSKRYRLSVQGLIGGHSGEDIDKNRLSAIKLLGDLLNSLNPDSIIDFKGGTKNNVISTSASCVISSSKTLSEIEQVCNFFVTQLKGQEDGLEISCLEIDNSENEYDAESLLKFLNGFQQGVVVMGENSPILSENFGSIVFIDGSVKIKVSLRSSDNQEEKVQIEKLKHLAKDCGFEITIGTRAPNFNSPKDSKLVKLLEDTYQKLYSKKARRCNIHAGLECGIISENIRDLDVCVIGSDLYDLHATTERASISSMGRTYKWVYETLKEFVKN